jgi:lysophospholipase L1-like esterase
MIRLALACLAACVLAGPVKAEDPGPDPCPATPSMPPLEAIHLRAAVERKAPLVIVALGSSSTQGWMASDQAHTYPAVLQARLQAALPGEHVVVLNRGIGGQDAAEEVARLEPDVIAARPQLVIWQVGANGALKNMEPSVFHKLIAAGVHRMKAADIDVVLMDNQRSPLILAAPEHAQMDAILAEASRQHDVSLFSRGALMEGWQAEGAPYPRFISPDGLHHNDLGYRCVAEALAADIVKAIRSRE